MTRFLIQLQEAAFGAAAEGYDSGSTASISTLRFVRADVDKWVRDECGSLPGMGEGTGQGDMQWGEECIDALECVRRKLGAFEEYMPEDVEDGHI